MKIFGVNVELDFRAPDLEEIDAKLTRYDELRGRVETPSAVVSPEWEQDMSEQVDLYYELKENVAGFPNSEDVEEDTRPWWQKIF